MARRWVFLLASAVLFFYAPELRAKGGVLHGVIRDGGSGDKLIGASVFLIGTKMGTTTDLDGEYRIEGIPAGFYDVRFSFMGYEPVLIESFEIHEHEKHKLNASLKTDQTQVFTLEEIRVTAERVLSTATAMLTDRMKSAAIGDAISADQISKSPDATSGDALRRVTGLSLVDDKFVTVRGVTDRYNGTSLDGVNVTGTDTNVDKKSFSYDLIPAALLSNTVVVKTATPDLPGDFSGGYVQVNTLDFPSERVISAGFSIGGDDITTNGRMLVPAVTGDKDWLGMDDGSREFPFPDRGVRDPYYNVRENRYELAQSLPNTWGISAKHAPYKKSYNLAYGDHYLLPGDSELGVIGAWVYRNDYSVEDFIQDRRAIRGELMHMNGRRNRYEVLWGLLLNASYRFSWLGRNNHEISFKNSRTQSAESVVGGQEGVRRDTETIRRQYIEWSQRSMYVGQLGGRHSFRALRSAELEWKYHWNRSRADEPDRRQVDYKYDDEKEFWLLEDNTRSWSGLDEDLKGYGADLTYDLTNHAKFKAGIASESRSRTYDIQSWVTDRNGLYEGSCFGKYGRLLLLPPDQVFAPENYGPCKFDFLISNGFTGNYEGKQDILSYYVMADVPFGLAGQEFRVVGGARAEDSDQEVSSELPFKPDDNSVSRIDKKDLLPSVNFTYLLNQYTEKVLGDEVKGNLRLAYGRAVNRPELREMSSVIYFDFNEEQNVVGRPGLDRAVIDNYDIRFEIFPGAGEVLAFSLFKKNLSNAIEDTLFASPERFIRSFRNAPDAKNNGWEIEMRKNLGVFGRYMENLALGVNYTRVFSKVPFVEHVSGGTRTLYRTLHGQSPWALNASISFTEPTVGTSVTLLYNKIGRRLDALMENRGEDVFEEPRDLIDLAISQPLAYKTRLKFSAKNLTGSDEKLSIGTEAYPYAGVSKGTSYSLSLSYRF